jgi:hypothetical protein
MVVTNEPAGEDAPMVKIIPIRDANSSTLQISTSLVHNFGVRPTGLALGMRLSSVPLDDGDDGNENVTIELYENIPISDNDATNNKESIPPRQWITFKHLLCCCWCFRRGTEFQPLTTSVELR